jgi:HSP20 family molecular chaperone IbpA
MFRNQLALQPPLTMFGDPFLQSFDWLDQPSTQFFNANRQVQATPVNISETPDSIKVAAEVSPPSLFRFQASKRMKSQWM